MLNLTASDHSHWHEPILRVPAPQSASEPTKIFQTPGLFSKRMRYTCTRSTNYLVSVRDTRVPWRETSDRRGSGCETLQEETNWPQTDSSHCLLGAKSATLGRQSTAYSCDRPCLSRSRNINRRPPGAARPETSRLHENLRRESWV